MTTTAEHPADVLRQRGNAVTADPYGHVAAAVLTQHETDNNVTFIGVDNDALGQVHEALDAYRDRTDLLTTLGTLEDVVAAVNNLLGLSQ